ncbi:MAG: DegT/DnrJ/EryC1/StrS family aminotransferase [Patescibacteria group bacterium]
MAKRRQIGIGNITIDALAKRYLMDVLASGRLSYGDFTRRFESQMAKLHDRRWAIFCNSGTSALHVSLSVLKDKYGWRDEDEVIVPSVTFIATSNVVLHNRLTPVFVDVERDYFGIDPGKIEEKISKRTRAIMPVHLFGQSCDMQNIVRIAKKHKLMLVEDSCEAMFVKYRGKPVGSAGDIACFSTYATHLITTGVGGFAMTNDNDLAIMIKSYFNHGRDGIYLSIDDDNTTNHRKLLRIVERRFSFVHLGYSFRLTELEAALGMAQLSRWKSIIKKRQANANYLTRHLKKYEGYLGLPKIRPGAQHAFMLYPIVINNPQINREKLIEHLETRGIETRYLMPLINQPIYVKMFGNLEDQYPVARFLNRNGFIIGCHQDLTKKELDYIIDTFDRFFEK